MLIKGITTAHKWIAVIGLLSLTALSLIAAQRPLNTVVDIGTPKTYLNCSNSGVPSGQFSWTIQDNYNIFTPPRTIVNGCTSTDPLYEVDSSTPNSCNLIILNAQKSEAGRYTCSPRGQPDLSAEFFVMDSQLICGSRGNKMNGYTFYCGVSYSGVRFKGYLTIDVGWYGESAVTKPPRYYYYNGTIADHKRFDIFSITSGVYKVPQNLCRIKYIYNNITTGQATNLPSYDSQCNVTEFTENKELTYIRMSRNFGILAGGTRIIITITSQGFPDDVAMFFFGDYGHSVSIFNSVKRINMSCLMLDIYSPPASKIGNASIIIRNSFQSAPLYNDGFDWTDPTAYFEYRANPTVTKLYPTTHITSGGTRITIEGTNLDAAESFRLEMNVTIHKNSSQENINITSADCFGIIHDTDPAYSKNKRLLCRMPMLNLPQDFLKTLEETVKKSSNPSTTRRKRSVNGDFEVTRITNKFGEVAVAQLSLVMDNLPPVLIESFTVDFIPTSLIKFNITSAVVRIKSGKPENREIRGTYLDKIAADNFVITVGNANCTIQSKTDNVILYLPPKDKPGNRSVKKDAICNSEMLDIMVSINQEHHNYTQWVYGCAEYYNPFPLLLVVLVTVLGGILFIIISMVLIILCYKKCSKNNSSSNNNSGSATSAVTFRNKSPGKAGKGVRQNVHKSNGDDLSKYQKTIPDDSIDDDSITYSKKVNYNRVIPSIYP